MKIICVEDDHPLATELLKKCRSQKGTDFEETVTNVRDALNVYLSKRSGVMVFDVDEDMPRIKIKTFGNFDVFVEGKPVFFDRAKSKEILAYLVDRQGSGATRAEIFAALFEDDVYDRPRQRQFDVMIRSLKKTLTDYNIEHLFEMDHGMLRIVPELCDCDLYRFLAKDEGTVQSYRGEYMSNYSWAMMTEAFLDQRILINV